jgi:hypothetical protein
MLPRVVNVPRVRTLAGTAILVRDHIGTIIAYYYILRWKPQIRALAIPSNHGFRDSRENPVAIAHLHTTLNKSRDEKLIVPP